MMKATRYRLSLSVSSGRPAGFTDDAWPRERTPFLISFRPRAERYRRRRRLGLYLMFGFMLGGIGLANVNLPDSARFSAFALLVLAWLGAVVTLLFGLKLRCPACRNRLEPAKGLYCPQCGSDQFQHGVHRRKSSNANHRYCPSCDNTIEEEDGDSSRSYCIRGCTHCGVMLDEKGL